MAFPENIAYFYPAQPRNQVIITALYDQTEVVIKWHKLENTLTLSAGETRAFDVEADLELSRSEISDSSLQISGSKPITVSEVRQKHHSLQTSLVTPTDKLGTDYLIPPAPAIGGTGDPAGQMANDTFRIIIINTGQHNTVILTGVGSRAISLLPRQVASIRLKAEEAFRAVSAKLPVAVLFGHACAHLSNCTCAQLYAVLPPTKAERQKYYIPPFLTQGTENRTYVLVSEEESRQVNSTNETSPLLEAAGSAILHYPGLLLPLIPETDHGTCSIVVSVPNATNWAVIVVHRTLTAGVHLGHRSLESLDWQQLEGHEYVWGRVALESPKSVIWHSSSKMAVYSFGTKDGQMFGSPAAVVSKTAGRTDTFLCFGNVNAAAVTSVCLCSACSDFRGCLLVPEVVRVGEVAGGWRESLQYCQNRQLELISLSRRGHWTRVYSKILQDEDAGPTDLWIGMRRSSRSGRWYWLSNDPVTETDWAEGEPGTLNDAQCAMLTRKSSHFSWRDENCCRNAHPVCYKDPVLLPIEA